MNCSLSKTNCSAAYCVVLYAVLVAFKLCTCSVSLGGDCVRSVVTADYWNFGKGIASGQVLYRDLVDHKGAYLYGVYALLFKASGGDVSVVPVAETLVFAATILSAHFLCKSVLGSKSGGIASALFAASYAALTIHCPMVNTEPLLLPALFFAQRTIAFRKSMGNAEFFAWGFASGLFVNAKYASVAYIAPIAVLAVHRLSGNRRLCIAAPIVSALAGVVAANLPFVAYLLRHGTARNFVSITMSASHCNPYTAVGSAALAAALLALSLRLSKKASSCEAKDDARKAGGFCESKCVSLAVASSLVLSLPMLTFKTYMISPLVAMAFSAVVFGERRNLWRRSLFYAAFSAMVVHLVVVPCMSKTKTRSIASELGMTSENTLYLCEDLGFGVYGGESMASPLQWIPAKCMLSSEFANYICALERQRISECKFRFIVAPCSSSSSESDKTDEQIMWEKLQTDAAAVYEEVWREDDSFCIYELSSFRTANP